VETVAFDGRALSSPAGGVRRYTSELYTALAADYPAVRWVAVGVDAAAIPGVDAVPAGWSLPTNAGWMLTGLPATLRRLRPDVCHAPAYAAPIGAGCPIVLTVHDVSYERHPEWYPGRIDPLRRALFRRSAVRAARIITDSQFSRSEIIAAYGIASERIDVVPLGVSAAFTPPPTGEPRACMVLHVGDLHPRRNLSMLLGVVLALRQQVPSLAGLTLTLAGVDRGVGSALRAQAATAGAPQALSCVGTVTEGQLLTLYQTAMVMAYPSRYEGFGLPVLEAMACGAPVVASRSASLPDVAGDAGMLVDAEDPRAWADALRAVLGDANRASALAQAGIARAAQFTWTRTATATFESLRRGAAPR